MRLEMTSMNAQVAREGVRAILDHHLEEGSITGAVVLLGQGGNAQVVVAGTAAAGSSERMRHDTIFRIASLTKPIVTAAAMMLIEEGKLRLDEPVDRLLPELANRRVLKRLDGPLDDTVAALRPITLADVLSYRCGLGLVLAPPGSYPIQRAIAELGLVGFGPPDPASPLGPDEWLQRLSTLPLMGQPGEDWLYTAGSNVLGVLIARAEGKPLPQVLTERIFAPLRMRDTGFFVPKARRARFTAAYRPARAGLELCDGVEGSAWGAPPAFPAGDGGLVSTALDFFAFTHTLSRSARASQRSLLCAASIAAMATDQLTSAQRQGGQLILGPDRSWGYGLGVQIARSPEGVPPGAFGWDGGSGTSWRFDPVTEQTVIVLTQTQFTSPDPPQIHKDVWRSVF
jgi:CubicO group peptidase (beta-lactamase class C family)